MKPRRDAEATARDPPVPLPVHEATWCPWPAALTGSAGGPKRRRGGVGASRLFRGFDLWFLGLLGCFSLLLGCSLGFGFYLVFYGFLSLLMGLPFDSGKWHGWFPLGIDWATELLESGSKGTCSAPP